MAVRKMTFSLPESLAAEFIRTVPARERSRYLSQALAARLAGRHRRFVQACEAANLDPDVLEIEREFADLPDETSEPWRGSAPR